MGEHALDLPRALLLGHWHANLLSSGAALTNTR